MIAELRPKLEARLEVFMEGATWEDAVPLLEAIPSEVLKECAEKGSIESIIKTLTDASGPLSMPGGPDNANKMCRCTVTLI